MEPQQLVTIILVLVLSVIAWIAGWSKGYNAGISDQTNCIVDALYSMGVSTDDVKKVINKAMQQLTEKISKIKTPTDEQQG